MIISNGNGTGPRSPAPIVVLTTSRSGSTLLRFILDTHPDLACPPETGMGGLCTYLTRFLGVLDGTAADAPPGHGAIAADTEAAIVQLLNDSYGRYLRGRGKRRWCDTITGWLPLAAARRSGYMPASNGGGGQILALDAGLAVSYHIPATDNTMRTELKAVLTGVGAKMRGPRLLSGGCLRAGMRALLGERDPTPRQLADDIDAVPLFLTEEALGDMEADARVQDVTARWRACMSRVGYSYPSPAAAQADPRWLKAAEGGASMAKLVTMEEPVASADARCRATVNYAGIRLAIFNADLSRLISDSRTASRLQQFQAQVSYAVRNAKKALLKQA